MGEDSIRPEAIPRHIAVIMDGNGRWAEERGLARTDGHHAGVDAVRKIVRAARDLGVSWLTLFAFSSENWNRPKSEVDELMKGSDGRPRASIDALVGVLPRLGSKEVGTWNRFGLGF